MKMIQMFTALPRRTQEEMVVTMAVTGVGILAFAVFYCAPFAS